MKGECSEQRFSSKTFDGKWQMGISASIVSHGTRDTNNHGQISFRDVNINIYGHLWLLSKYQDGKAIFQSVFEMEGEMWSIHHLEMNEISNWPSRHWFAFFTEPQAEEDSQGLVKERGALVGSWRWMLDVIYSFKIIAIRIHSRKSEFVT